MNLRKFKSKVAEIDKIIPRDKWIEIPPETKYWGFFGLQGLYAFYDEKKVIYIGISSDLNLRLKTHISHNGKFGHRNSFSKIKIKISSLDRVLLEQIEKRLTYRLKPIFNNQVISIRWKRKASEIWDENKVYKYKKRCKLATCQRAFKTNYKRQVFCQRDHSIEYHEINTRKAMLMFEKIEKGGKYD